MTILAFIFWVVIALFASGIVTHRKDTQPKNNVHFYVARDKDGRLYLYIGKPVRENNMFLASVHKGVAILGCNSDLEWYGLNESDYDYLKWEDEPVEVFLNSED